MKKGSLECPRCFYKTTQRSHMKNHMNRKTDCNEFSKVELTYEIKSRILCRHIKVIAPSVDIVPEPIVNPVEPLVASINNNYNLSVYLSMTNDTSTIKKILDTFYGYNSVIKSYMKRIHDNKLISEWRLCSLKEIFSEIFEQLKVTVFIPYEVQLNKQYKIDRNITHLVEFYKMCKYLLIKPLCCAARDDNQVLFFNTDVEYAEHPGNTELVEDLNVHFTATFIDTHEMMKFRDGIEELIQTNTETTFNMIQDHICGALKITSHFEKKT